MYKVQTLNKIAKVGLNVYDDKSTYGDKVENPDDYDIVLDRTPGYNHSTYSVIKNNTELSQLELALICDDGNLCFGYTMQGSQFYIFED